MGGERGEERWGEGKWGEGRWGEVEVIRERGLGGVRGKGR